MLYGLIVLWYERPRNEVPESNLHWRQSVRQKLPPKQSRSRDADNSLCKVLLDPGRTSQPPWYRAIVRLYARIGQGELRCPSPGQKNSLHSPRILWSGKQA